MATLTGGQSGRVRIALAAERLIAERGIDVPFRDIAAGAGQRNNSAVHYHFGSREGLVHAVLELRTAPQDQRRLELLAEHEESGCEDTVETLVEIMVRPTCEVPYAAGATHYARFLEQVRNHPALAAAELTTRTWPVSEIVVTRLARLLDHLPRPVRRRRLESMMTVYFTLLADHERRWDGNGSPAPSAEEVDDIVAMVSGLLRAAVRERA